MYIKAIGFIALLLVAISNTPLVLAHAGATGVVKERMHLMKDMKEATKSLSALFKGERPYSEELVRNAALVLKETSGEKLTRLFPQGSLNSPSEAKQEIWSEWDKFESLAERLQWLSEALIHAANNKPSDFGDDNSKSSVQSMMGVESQMGNQGMSDNLSFDQLSQMPSDRVFKMIADTCSSCHTKYRIEKE